MKKFILIYGVIAGVLVIGSMMLGLALADGNASTSGLEWLGYLTMIVTLSMIFVGIKRYRDRELGGVIRFGTAFLLGLGITAVAGVIYVVVWEINLSLTDYAFIDDYTAAVIEEKKASGLEGAELEKAIAKMEELKVNYGNPLFRMPMTFLEIFPVGLVIALLSAAILRNQKVLPAAA